MHSNYASDDLLFHVKFFPGGIPVTPNILVAIYLLRVRRRKGCLCFSEEFGIRIFFELLFRD